MYLVAFGASLGGLDALGALLPELPTGLPAAFVVVQHRLVDEASHLVELLDRHSKMAVVEPCDGDPLEQGKVYLAPCDYHLLIEDGRIALSTDEPVSFARPSIDVLFESAADAYGDHTIAVVLTGASEDGAQGAASVARAGGVVLVQSPTKARSPVCPRATMNKVPTAEVIELRKLGPRLVELVGGGR